MSGFNPCVPTVAATTRPLDVPRIESPASKSAELRSIDNAAGSLQPVDSNDQARITVKTRPDGGAEHDSGGTFRPSESRSCGIGQGALGDQLQIEAVSQIG